MSCMSSGTGWHKREKTDTPEGVSDFLKNEGHACMRVTKTRFKPLINKDCCKMKMKFNGTEYPKTGF